MFTNKFNRLPRQGVIGAKPRALPHFSLASIRQRGISASCAAAPALSALSRPELQALSVDLFGEIATLKQTVAELREEIARLKGLKGRPNIKPSSMDKGTAPAKSTKNEKLARRARSPLGQHCKRQ